MNGFALSLPGLEETTIVRTAAFDDIRAKIELTSAVAGTMVVEGPHGCGKRVAVLSVLSELAVPSAVIDLQPGQSSKDLIRVIYNAVHSDRDVFDLRGMQDDLAATFATTSGVLVITNAHMLTPNGGGQLHYLHARPEMRWSFVLVGGPKTALVVRNDAQLRGDVIQAVQLSALKDNELWHVVRGMHELFRGADQPILDHFRSIYCGGLPKEWARVLQVSLYLRGLAVRNGREAPHLDRAFASLVASQLPRMVSKVKTNRGRRGAL